MWSQTPKPATLAYTSEQLLGTQLYTVPTHSFYPDSQSGTSEGTYNTPGQVINNANIVSLLRIRVAQSVSVKVLGLFIWR